MAAGVERDLAEAEAAFRRDSAGADTEWRRFFEDPTSAMLRMAHAADLILVSPTPEEPSGREVDPRQLVVGAGRPVLVVPPHARRLRTETIVVAWKDTRESRLAVSAATPFLQAAGRVVVHGVAGPDTLEAVGQQTQAVAAGLRRRGVEATGEVSASGDGVVNELMRAVGAYGADMLVAGAYGHARLQELVLGGVTEQLLRRPACFILMAH
jgi:nucleotide-binding universal stress UspA family protein